MAIVFWKQRIYAQAMIVGAYPLNASHEVFHPFAKATDIECGLNLFRVQNVSCVCFLLTERGETVRERERQSKGKRLKVNKSFKSLISFNEIQSTICIMLLVGRRGEWNKSLKTLLYVRHRASWKLFSVSSYGLWERNKNKPGLKWERSLQAFMLWKVYLSRRQFSWLKSFCQQTKSMRFEDCGEEKTAPVFRSFLLFSLFRTIKSAHIIATLRRSFYSASSKEIILLVATNDRPHSRYLKSSRHCLLSMAKFSSERYLVIVSLQVDR